MVGFDSFYSALAKLRERRLRQGVELPGGRVCLNAAVEALGLEGVEPVAQLRQLRAGEPLNRPLDVFDRRYSVIPWRASSKRKLSVIPAFAALGQDDGAGG